MEVAEPSALRHVRIRPLEVDIRPLAWPGPCGTVAIGCHPASSLHVVHQRSCWTRLRGNVCGYEQRTTLLRSGAHVAPRTPSAWRPGLTPLISRDGERKQRWHGQREGDQEQGQHHEYPVRRVVFHEDVFEHPCDDDVRQHRPLPHLEERAPGELLDPRHQHSTDEEQAGGNTEEDDRWPKQIGLGDLRGHNHAGRERADERCDAQLHHGGQVGFGSYSCSHAVASRVMMTRIATCIAPVIAAAHTKRLMRWAIRSPLGSGLRNSKSTARFAGSSTPRATTAMTATTMYEATAHPW